MGTRGRMCPTAWPSLGLPKALWKGVRGGKGGGSDLKLLCRQHFAAFAGKKGSDRCLKCVCVLFLCLKGWVLVRHCSPGNESSLLPYICNSGAFFVAATVLALFWVALVKGLGRHEGIFSSKSDPGTARNLS